MASVILGTWENTFEEGFDEYIKAIGFGNVNRDAFPKDVKGCVIFSDDGGKLSQKQTVGPVTIMEFNFELGVEFEQDVSMPGGGPKPKAKSVITLEGNKLTHKAAINGVDTVTVREFNGDEMVAVSTAGSVVCTRKYKKVA